MYVYLSHCGGLVKCLLCLIGHAPETSVTAGWIDLREGDEATCLTLLRRSHCGIDARPILYYTALCSSVAWSLP
jgi:hypothetical protein